MGRTAFWEDGDWLWGLGLDALWSLEGTFGTCWGCFVEVESTKGGVGN